MNTPIFDFLKNYARNNNIRLHMPGHKGRPPFPFEYDMYSLDITEINGADSLFESHGIIAQSEKNTARLYNAHSTCFSTGGSTLCIQTMLALMKRENRTVIAVRNVHRSFISACALLDIQPLWLFPEYQCGILSGKFPFETAEDLLRRNSNACVYLTSPDYLGMTADIKAVSGLCARYGARLIVDNAHGAHLTALNSHPIQLGADMCCDSAHKTLPALTGGAYLHSADPLLSGQVKEAMSLFGSTSPSYLIMASLDLCSRYIHEKLPEDTLRTAKMLGGLRDAVSSKYTVCQSEPFHLTLLCDGNNLAQKLRSRGIECEYSDESCIVLLFSPVSTESEISSVKEALMSLAPDPPLHQQGLIFPQPVTAMSIRTAVLKPYRSVPIEKSVGRVCAGVSVPCPPAVPIAVSGEVIDENCVKIFKRYGISRVNVL